MKEHTEELDAFLAVVAAAERVYCLSFLATAKFYEALAASSDSSVCFTSSSSRVPWHAPMARNDVMDVAGLMVAMPVINTAILVCQALSTYLMAMCQKVYQGTVDRSWFRPGMVQVATNVNPETCLNWAKVEELYRMWDNFTLLESEPNVGISQQRLFELFDEVRAFAQDFEYAFLIVHPEVKL